MIRTTLLTALFCCSLTATAVTVEVSNPTAMQRQELVEIPVRQLGFAVDKGLVVRDVSGIERPNQLTSDSLLLIDVHLRPYGTTIFTVEPGTPAAFKSFVSGRQYPERKDDLAFENDRIGFRAYGPALQQSGERGFGYDVWVKRTPRLILEELYRNDPRLSFHQDYGEGVDCYAVGPTLGCGTPALMHQGTLRLPYCYNTCTILDKGPLRFTVRLDFAPTADGIAEHRILSLDKGSNFCRSVVLYQGLTEPMDVAAGFAIRPADTTSVVMGRNYIHYADPTIDPDRYQTQVYVAVLFPDETVTTAKTQGHAVGISSNYVEGRRFHYYFGAAWSEFDVRSQAEWQSRIDGFLLARRQPIVVKVKK